MKVLVTGSSGFIGRALALRLAADGHHVLAGGRAAVSDWPSTSGRIESVRLALGGTLPPELLSGLSVVFHLAHDMTPGNGSLNREGTTAWMEQAREAGVPLQVYFSSYSARSDAPSEYGRVKHALERYAQDTIGAVVVRPGLVIGRGGSFGAMLRLMRQWPIVPVPGGNLQVFITGLPQLIERTVGITSASTREYNIFRREPVTLADLLRQAAAVLSLGTTIVSVPVGISAPLFGAGAIFSRAVRRQAESLNALRASQSYGYRSTELGEDLPLTALLRSSLID